MIALPKENWTSVSASLEKVVMMKRTSLANNSQGAMKEWALKMR